MTPRRTSVIIGSAFGDEGKGLMTDFLADRIGANVTVVRYNGGAQAGHTVQTPDGRRHVFHQFGSGALAGAATHLSRFFVANPILFLREREDLMRLKANTEVSISGDALISTPWDMFANTEIETARGAQRHGSCGMGIGETVGRQETTEHTLQVKDLGSPDLIARLTAIRHTWLPNRLATVGVVPDAESYSTIRSDGLFEQFLDDLATFREYVQVSEIDSAVSNQGVIFEGAQGLLLDQDAGKPWFPYVTRSNTGLRNVTALAGEAGISRLDVHYMTRTYLTRHGAGPLPFEYSERPMKSIVDQTNIPNPWQGTLRFAPLNLDLLGAAIRRDQEGARFSPGVDVRVHLGITCLDQTPGVVEIVERGKSTSVTMDHLVALAGRCVSAIGTLASRGPTRTTLSAWRTRSTAVGGEA